MLVSYIGFYYLLVNFGGFLKFFWEIQWSKMVNGRRLGFGNHDVLYTSYNDTRVKILSLPPDGPLIELIRPCEELMQVITGVK